MNWYVLCYEMCFLCILSRRRRPRAFPPLSFISSVLLPYWYTTALPMIYQRKRGYAPSVPPQHHKGGDKRVFVSTNWQMKKMSNLVTYSTLPPGTPKLWVPFVTKQVSIFSKLIFIPARLSNLCQGNLVFVMFPAVNLLFTVLTLFSDNEGDRYPL